MFQLGSYVLNSFFQTGNYFSENNIKKDLLVDVKILPLAFNLTDKLFGLGKVWFTFVPQP